MNDKDSIKDTLLCPGIELCPDCIHLIGSGCELPSSTVDPYDCPYYEEVKE